eukprot:CCRYP_006591-RA/>CCRYP_006591-RA protein AED:0.03 eAED:0.03 QI:3071/1/1/1/0.75/0.4/5/2863/486
MKFLQFFALSQSFSAASARLKHGERATAPAAEKANQIIDNSNNISPDDNNRIIGGKDAAAGRFSYVVSLADDVGHFCGGSLIAPDIVLTAAHCQGGSYNIIVGRQDLSDERSGEVIPMNFEMPHPEYDDTTTDNDFNLVFLSRPVSAKNLKLVTLNDEDDMPAVGDSVHVSGWGDTTKEDDIQTLSNALMTVELKVISNDECDASKGSIGGYDETYNGQITPNMMCAKDPNQDACQGDSGGPLVQGHRGPDGSDDVQVGVVSWGIGCAQASFPGVYSRVSKAYEWVKGEVCARSTDPPASFECDSPGMTSGSTSDTAVSAASAFVSSYHSKSGFRINEVQHWSVLIEDDFTSGYGFFNTGSLDSTLYKSAKGRSGVVRLSKGTSISSKIITDTSFSAFRVLLSFYYINMEEGLGLCLDYSDDKGESWKESACFSGGSSFVNDVWYDSMTAELRPTEQTESLMIRLRSNGSQGDVLVDKVVVQGLTQ